MTPLHCRGLQVASLPEDQEQLDPQTLQQVKEDNILKGLTIRELQVFLQAQPDKMASVLLIGDSTVRGMAEKLVNLTEISKVYRASDMLHYSNEHLDDKVQEGTLSHKAQLTAMRGYRALHDQNCTVSGALEATVFGAPLEGLVLYHWEFIPEYSDACYKPCLVDAAEAMKPTAVMWNVGLHLLSVNYDAKACAREHGKNHGKLHCNDYESLVAMGVNGLAPTSNKFVFRTTNSVCWDKIGNKPDWHDQTKRRELEETCHRECPDFSETDHCYDWLLDEHSTALQYRQAMRSVDQEILAAQADGSRSVHVLDAYAASHQNCDATSDGVHFTALDGQLVHDLAKILAAP